MLRNKFPCPFLIFFFTIPKWLHESTASLPSLAYFFPSFLSSIALPFFFILVFHPTFPPSFLSFIIS